MDRTIHKSRIYTDNHMKLFILIVIFFILRSFNI